MNKDVLAFIYLVSTFDVDEFTTVNNKTARIGEKRHRPPLQASVGEWCDAVQSREPRLQHSLIQVDSWRSEIRNTVNASAVRRFKKTHSKAFA